MARDHEIPPDLDRILDNYAPLGATSLTLCALNDLSELAFNEGIINKEGLSEYSDRVFRKYPGLAPLWYLKIAALSERPVDALRVMCQSLQKEAQVTVETAADWLMDRFEERGGLGFVPTVTQSSLVEQTMRAVEQRTQTSWTSVSLETMLARLPTKKVSSGMHGLASEDKSSNIFIWYPANSLMDARPIAALIGVDAINDRRLFNSVGTLSLLTRLSGLGQPRPPTLCVAGPYKIVPTDVYSGLIREGFEWVPIRSVNGFAIGSSIFSPEEIKDVVKEATGCSSTFDSAIFSDISDKKSRKSRSQ